MSNLSELLTIALLFGSELLKLLFKKSKWAKGDGRDSLLGIKRGNLSKTYKKYNFF